MEINNKRIAKEIKININLILISVVLTLLFSFILKSIYYENLIRKTLKSNNIEHGYPNFNNEIPSNNDDTSSYEFSAELIKQLEKSLTSPVPYEPERGLISYEGSSIFFGLNEQGMRSTALDYTKYHSVNFLVISLIVLIAGRYLIIGIKWVYKNSEGV